MLNNIGRIDGNIRALCLTRINILNEVVLSRRLPDKDLLPRLQVINRGLQDSLLIRCNLPDRVRKHERAEHTTCLRRDPDLTEGRTPDNTCLNMDAT